MNTAVEKVKIAGAAVVGGSSALATMYSNMPVELAVPVNTLILGIVGAFIRWVERKIFKEKERKKIEAVKNEQGRVDK